MTNINVERSKNQTATEITIGDGVIHKRNIHGSFQHMKCSHSSVYGLVQLKSHCRREDIKMLMLQLRFSLVHQFLN
jgi:hypothetical protein